MADLAPQQFASHWLQQLATDAAAPAAVRRHEPRGDVVIDVTIEGQRFQATIFDESVCIGPKGVGACELGVALINSDDEQPGAGRASWSICKYRHESAMALRLSESGRRALALEFGLPILPLIPPAERNRLNPAHFFYASKAFAALQAWAAAHPRKIGRVTGDSYLGRWPLAALEVGRGIGAGHLAPEAALET